MQVIVDHADLRSALQMCNTVGKQTLIRILDNVLLTAKDDVLTIASTDLELTVIVTRAAMVREAGSITVARDSLINIAKTANATISLATAENGRLDVKTGTASYALPTMPAEDFPTLPTMAEADSIELSASEILPMLRTVTYAQTIEETRFNLAGALMDVGKTALNVVATNGHLMALCSLPRKSKTESHVFIPANLARAATKLPDDNDVLVSWNQDRVGFELGATVMIGRKPDSNFPRYVEVIPKSHSKRVTVDVEQLRSAVSRVTPFSHATAAVKLDLAKEKLTLSTENTERGQGVDSVPTDYSGDALTIGLNGGYVASVLGTIDTANAMIELEDKVSCIVVRPVDSDLPFTALHVIMPMNLEAR